MPEQTEQQEQIAQVPNVEIPRTAVPHLVNEDLLAWHKAHFEALREINTNLERIATAVEANRSTRRAAAKTPTPINKRVNKRR